jgi:hypothetical protein
VIAAPALTNRGGAARTVLSQLNVVASAVLADVGRRRSARLVDRERTTLSCLDGDGHVTRAVLSEMELSSGIGLHDEVRVSRLAVD